MKAVETLPEGYSELYSVDLQKNKIMSLLVNLLAVIIAVLLLVPMLFWVPISSLFVMDKGLGNYALRFITLIVLTIAYMILHEITHGIAMKICGTKKVKYGFTGLYAFAGSNDYYRKKPIYSSLWHPLFCGDCSLQSSILLFRLNGFGLFILSKL